MESAIPSHLRTERTCPRRGYEDFKPPYPSFVARYDKTVKTVVMAYFGVQFKAERSRQAMAALKRLDIALGNSASPSYWDRARYVDEAGYDTLVTVAYWRDLSTFD